MMSSFKYKITANLLWLVLALSLTVNRPVHAEAAIDYRSYISAVYKNHPRIKEQSASVKAQEFQIDSARATRLPSIKIGSRYTASAEENSNLSFSVPVYTFGRISNAIDKEGEKYRLENLRLLKTSNDVIEENTSTYLDYVFNSKKYAVLNRTYKGLSHLLERIKRRRDSGYDSNADVNSAKSRVLQGEARAQRQAIAVRNIMNEMVVLYGDDISEVYPLPENYFQINDIDSFIPLVLKQNPGILLAEQEVVVAERELLGVKLNNRPSFEFYASDGSSNPFNERSSVGISVDYDWENLGRAVAAGANTAEFELVAKEQALANTQQEVSITLQNLINDFTSLDAQLKQQDNILDSLQETKMSFSRQYEAGRKSLMELLNIYNELAEAELLQLDLERQRIGYQVRFYSLVGAIYLAATTENLPSQLTLLSSGAQ